MITKRLNYNLPERVFIAVKNNQGATLVQDSVVTWELAPASVDGVNVDLPATASLLAFAGVVDADIPAGEYGLIQIYGYRSTSKVFQTNTSQAAGVGLIPVNGQAYLASAAMTVASAVAHVIAVLGESITDAGASATVSRKIFIRGM